MANWIGIAGGSESAREAFLLSATAELAPFPGLSCRRTQFGAAALAWSSPPSAPLSIASDEEASAYFLGRLWDGKGEAQSFARAVLERRRKDGPAAVSCLNGYYTAFTSSRDGLFAVGADTLGLFPVYYYSTPEYFIFSSTPAAFRHFHSFSPRLSVPGLVGVLLTNFLVDGQTLLEGVKRLSPQSAVLWKAGKSAFEVKANVLAPSDRFFGASFDENAERIDALMEGAVKNASAQGRTAMLLSGGLDSRLLAGYLGRSFGQDVAALTQGGRDDFEMGCAREVAAKLGWRHLASLPDDAIFEEQALLKIRHEHLSSGFNTAFFMQLVPQLSGFSEVYSGVHGDSSLGMGTLGRVGDPETGSFGFDPHFRHLNRQGLSPDAVRNLIPASLLKTSLEDTIEKLRIFYGRLPGLPFQRAWLFDLLIADRLQIGFIPRMLAFGAWPALPFVDRTLLDAVASMPYDALKDRRMETELVCRRFPSLSVLRLDRNSYNTAPVFGLRRLRSQRLGVRRSLKLLEGHLSARFSSAVGQAARAAGKDRRFYYNTFDLNRSGWKAVRRRAERSRRKLDGLMDLRALESLWPGPETEMVFSDGITDAQPMKTLVGFALWAEENL